MFVQFISPGQFVAPFSLRLYVQDVGRADAFDKCALPKTNGYDNSTIRDANSGRHSGTRSGTRPAHAKCTCEVAAAADCAAKVRICLQCPHPRRNSHESRRRSCRDRGAPRPPPTPPWGPKVPIQGGTSAPEAAHDRRTPNAHARPSLPQIAL